jgi:hypothetical protein
VGEGVWLIVDVGEGVFATTVTVAEAVSWLFTMAAIVALIRVWFGVVVLIGRLSDEMRLITCHKMKITPAATSSHIRAVNTPNRMGVRFFSATVE